METEIKNDEIAEAIEIVKNAVAEHGTPVWVVKVPMSVRRIVPAEIKKEILADAKVSEGWAKDIDGSYVKGRLDFRSVIITWAKDKVFQQVTVKDIAEATGASQNIVRDVIGDRPDIFRKSEGWTYEIRDPQADRKAGK